MRQPEAFKPIIKIPLKQGAPTPEFLEKVNQSIIAAVEAPSPEARQASNDAYVELVEQELLADEARKN